jgi:hypothetical protein
MRFLFPRFPAEFEIPDDWWVEASMTGFTPLASAYRSTPEATCAVPLFDIEPPFRLPTVPKDFHGFDRERMIRLLRGMATDVVLPPVGLLILPPLADISVPPFKYRLLCGVHRFYASIAAGFEFLPSAMRETCL